jgi:hypothetical protein
MRCRGFRRAYTFLEPFYQLALECGTVKREAI